MYQQSQIEKDYLEAIERLKVAQERWIASLRPGDLIITGGYPWIDAVEGVADGKVLPKTGSDFSKPIGPTVDIAPRPLLPTERDRYERAKRTEAFRLRLCRSDDPLSGAALDQIEAALGGESKAG